MSTKKTSPAKKTDLAMLTMEQLSQFVASLGEPAYRAKQLGRWIHGRGAREFAEMTDLRKSLRLQLQEVAEISGLEMAQVIQSIDGTRKIVLQTEDHLHVEAVLIPDPGEERARRSGIQDSIPRDRLTLCLSTQIGCGLGCTFCYTASLGLTRNMTTAEILSQVHRARESLAADERITNLVLMGMGEPLANYEQTLHALRTMLDPNGMNLSPRRVTVSTAGLPKGIARLGRDIGVGLAVSLNAATDELRRSLMPVAGRTPLKDLLAACRRYPLPPRRRITFEYVLLAGVNDSPADARLLPPLLKGIRCKLNLIPFNPHPAATFQRPTEEAVERFAGILHEQGLAVSVRRSRGADISAACGLLGGRQD